MVSECTPMSQADVQVPNRLHMSPLRPVEQISLPLDSHRKRSSENQQTARGETVRVRVVARVRPLLPLETVGPRKGSECVEVASPSVAIGKSCFTFDHVFGPEASQEEVYAECVEPLVEATLEGINGTVLAYGQTGSGKTFTMGTSGLPSVPEGALQRALHAIFSRAQAFEDGSTTFHVSFVEIFTDTKSKNTEEIRDLLSPGKSSVFAAIKTDLDGQIRLDGVVEHEVSNEKEAFTLLALGSASRATCATRMNDSSSRSHAIFSLEVLQRSHVGGVPSTLTSRFQFVDLAGSEKVKISGVEGDQLSQAININHGLFVLGKVITALTDGHSHVPFRESKLTRILQNSLGGNSRTCMVACVSPSDSNLAETVSTLTYAAKAKEIRNKPVVNRGVSCPNCSILQSKIEVLEGASAGKGIAQNGSHPKLPSPVRSAARQERFHSYVVELEKENVNLRQENCQLREKLELRVASSCNGLETLDDRIMNNEVSTIADAKAVADANAAAARADALYKRCSERLAALQQAVQVAEYAVDDSLLLPEDTLNTISDADTFTLGGGSDDMDASTKLDFDDSEVIWLDQEHRRKQSLLLQVESNYQAMATFEAQSKERIRQHEAARDIAERELARLQSELEVANSRADKFKSTQERYNQKLKALEERKLALEKEHKENRRLRNIQKQQETRLKVLRDSVRQVKDEKDALKSQLKNETRRHREKEAEGKKLHKNDQIKIQKLSARVADLERSSATGAEGGGSRLRTRSALKADSASKRLAHKLRSPSTKLLETQNEPWRKLLDGAAELAHREQLLRHAQVQRDEVETQLLQIRARCERLSVESEVDGKESELTAAQQELSAVQAALEYHKEHVWLLTRERDACQPQGGSLARAAAICAEGMVAEERSSALVWLCMEAAAHQNEVALAYEIDEAREADLVACQEALADSHHRAAELEQAFDFDRGNYESRIAYLISCVNAGTMPQSDELCETLGEETSVLLTRRIGELEAQLSRERRESQDRVQRRLEQDMELITNYREQESENKLLRTQLTEATSAVERAIARGATKEMQLLQKISRLEEDLAAKPKEASVLDGPHTAEVSWGLKYLEEFWRSTGLDSHKEDLLASLKADVESLCNQRLSDHMEWKRALEGKIYHLQLELSDLGSLLGEAVDIPLADITLLQKAQDLEASIGVMMDMKMRRCKSLEELKSQIEATHARLHEHPLQDSLPVVGDHGALHSSTIAMLRERHLKLEEMEIGRQKVVTDYFNKIQQLWGTIGLEAPDDLEPIELELLQGPLPVSDSCMTYLTARFEQLAAWRDNLEPEESALHEKLTSLHKQLDRFGISLPEAPLGLSLVPRIKSLRKLAAAGEVTAKEFVLEQRSVLDFFSNATHLENVRKAYAELQGVSELYQELKILGSHWDRISAQRAEHHRISELIASREALESEMQLFDAQASTPDRFKQRGYSGVQENKIRADFQRRLRMLDSSLNDSMSEWAAREGVTFCKEGIEYRGFELLPSNHTHMYAWTGKQMAQKQEKQVGARSTRDRDQSPRDSIPPESQRSPRQTSVQMSGRRSMDFTLPAGANSPRTRPRTGTTTPRGNNRGSPGPTRNAASPQAGATRNSTGNARSPPPPTSARKQAAPPPPAVRRISR